MVFSPARVRDVITVGSYDHRDSMCKFSNFGQAVDILAPGYSLYTYSSGSGEKSITHGTSASTAIVTGGLALLLSKRPNLAPREVKAELMNAALTRISSVTDSKEVSKTIKTPRGTTDLAFWCGNW